MNSSKLLGMDLEEKPFLTVAVEYFPLLEEVEAVALETTMFFLSSINGEFPILLLKNK